MSNLDMYAQNRIDHIERRLDRLESTGVSGYPCPVCQRRGYEGNGHDCKRCNGGGVVQTLSVGERKAWLKQVGEKP